MLTKKQNINNRKIILLQKDIKEKEIAKRIGVSDVTVYKAINGNFKSAIRCSLLFTAISNVLGVTKEEFWPEFYGETETGKSENVQQNAPQCI